jgi:hypothetical protein
MKIEEMYEGQKLFTIRRWSMGNRTWRMEIIEVDKDGNWVLASCNCNPPRRYSQAQLASIGELYE